MRFLSQLFNHDSGVEFKSQQLWHFFSFMAVSSPEEKPSRISNVVEHSPIPKFKSDDYKYK